MGGGDGEEVQRGGAPDPRVVEVLALSPPGLLLERRGGGVDGDTGPVGERTGGRLKTFVLLPLRTIQPPRQQVASLLLLLVDIRMVNIGEAGRRGRCHRSWFSWWGGQVLLNWYRLI